MGNKHDCQFLWESPGEVVDGQLKDVRAVAICWHKSKWFLSSPVDKTCPHMSQEEAEACPMYVARRKPKITDDTVKLELPVLKQDPDWWKPIEKDELKK